MSDPNQIREAVNIFDLQRESKKYPGEKVITDAALAYADSLEDPIWWCFEHFSIRRDAVRNLCFWAMSEPNHTDPPCDTARATRPRRIE